MKISRLSLLATLLGLGCFFQGCDKEQEANAITSSVDGSWQASFRVSSGELTETQLSQASWVRVEAWRNGSLLTYSEAAFSARKVTLTIPNAGAVDIKLTGYSSSSKSTVMWSGTGAVSDGVSMPGKNVVTLVAGPGLTPASSVVAPEFSPAGGTYTVAKSVSLSTTTSGATIYYTTDGSVPTTSSSEYSGSAITVSANQTLKAIAVKSGMTNSSVSSAVYTISVSTTPITTGDIPWQAGITYGSVTHGGQTYKTVVIGGKEWMAENLNYAGASGTVGKCYNNSTDSCTKYGRLYTWAEVMQGKASSTTSPSGVQGICPTGWHVPSDAEWQALEVAVGMSAATAATSGWRGTTEGTKLQSTAGWYSSGNGTDDYGFRALPGGTFDGASFYSVGSYGYWWSATEYDASYAWYRSMYDSFDYVYRYYNLKTNGFSLRCSKD